MTNPISIVDSVMRMITPEATSSLAWRFGGSSAAVQSGIEASAAALIAGIASHASDPGLMAQIFNLVHESDMNSILRSIPKIASGGRTSFTGEPGLRLASMVFDYKQAAIEEAIAHQAGLGASAGSELMSFAAPLVVEALRQHILSRGQDINAFTSLARSEAAKSEGMLPIGTTSFLAAVSASSLTGRFMTTDGLGKTHQGIPLIALLVLPLIAWPFFHGCKRSQQPASPASVAEAAAPTSLQGSLGDLIKRRLPDGTELNIPRLGIENRLINFIEDPSQPVDKTTWFDFDRLTFDTGKATLQISSDEQLQNVAAILKAYPKVKAKIGGYTDNTGNKQANLQLSQSRANNVMHDIVDRGIDSSRLVAKGYGEEHPVADNTTEEGRQKNRRISLLVTEK